MKYSYESRVGYSEVSEKGEMTIGAIIDRFQDCSNFQSNELGVGIDYLMEKKRVWLLYSWQIQFDKRLRMGEDIRLSTWAYHFDKMYGYRNFLLEDAGGRSCARADSKWLLFDMEKSRPRKVETEDVEAYGMEERLEMVYADKRITVPEDLAEAGEFQVRGYQIDTNGHMNNSWYVKMAFEYLSEGFPVRQLRVEYKKAAMRGAHIFVKKFSEKNREVVALCDNCDKIYAIVEWME